MLHVIGIDARKIRLAALELAGEALDGDQRVIGGAGAAEEAAQSGTAKLHPSIIGFAQQIVVTLTRKVPKAIQRNFAIPCIITSTARGVHVKSTRGAVEGEGFVKGAHFGSRTNAMHS